MEASRIIILDGHDGSGKTSLANLLAKKLDAIVIKPFKNEISDKFYEYLDSKEYGKLNSLSIKTVIEECEKNSDKPILIFDRHWLTLFSLVPEIYYNGWTKLDRSCTFLCWSEPEIIYERLCQRGEKRRNNLPYHQHYCSLFRELAMKYNVPVINTQNPDIQIALNEILHILSTNFGISI